MSDAPETSRDALSSFRGAGLALREEDIFREITGDDAEREGLPGRECATAPGVALILRNPLVLPSVPSLGVNIARPFGFRSADLLPFECSCTISKPFPESKPLGRGGISSSGGEAGRIGIDPGDDVSSSIWLGDSFNMPPLIARGDMGVLSLRLVPSLLLLLRCFETCSCS